MREVIGDIERWRAGGHRVVVARVVGVEGSGPRDPGATMVVNEAGEVAGSVSGGCVEGAVVTEALQALESGQPKLVTFGYSDDEAFTVGLSCGGTLQILVDPVLPPVYEALREALGAEEPVALATVCGLEVAGGAETAGGVKMAGGAHMADGAGVAGGAVAIPALGATMLLRKDGRREGGLGNADLDRVVEWDGRGALASGLSSTRHYGAHGEARKREVSVFVEVFAPPPQLIIFGAVDFTGALVRVSKTMGYRVTVCDPRPVFATRARFPVADEVVVDWPDRYLAKVGSALTPRDAVCVLTHDAKFDVPAIVSALATEVGYIGAMGSRKTHQARVKRLREAGVGEHGLAKIRAPIGIDIGARTPEETAVAIFAEIIASQTGRHVPALGDGQGPIHTGRRA